MIISPHPKEFIKLYKMCFNHNLDLEILQKNRFLYAKAFTQKYNCVLVLKGANTIIAQKKNFLF